MENSLELYLNKRLGKHEHGISSEYLKPGPVVTISREVGCGAVKLAKKLSEELNKLEGSRNWRVLSKEIFEESARELDMDQQKISKFFKAEERNTVDEILAAFSSKRFKSESAIRKTVLDVIRSFAIDGHCIIVGRGGHIITKNIERSLHIKLSAPLEWRIEKIMKSHQIGRVQAKEFIEKTEKERENFRRNLCAKEINNEQFDLVINVSEFSTSSILELLHKALELKNMLKPHSLKVTVI